MRNPGDSLDGLPGRVCLWAIDLSADQHNDRMALVQVQFSESLAQVSELRGKNTRCLPGGKVNFLSSHHCFSSGCSGFSDGSTA